MLKINYHWRIKDDNIFCYVRVSNQLELIAEVIEERPIRQMLRYSQLGQDAEYIVDRIVAGKLSDKQAVEELVKLVKDTIEDTSSRQKVNCPEVE